MKSIAILLFPDVLMLDVAGPVEVFSIANRYLAEEEHYQITTVAFEDHAIRASNGLTMQADRLCREVDERFDLLLVPGGPGAYQQPHDCLLAWLQRVAGSARRFGSVCTGAFILGEAGLLDGHRVTTHWNYLDRLAKRFPAAIVEPERICITDQRLVTSGGVTAGIDMALAIVAQDHGKAVALSVAKVLLVVMKRQGGQAQFGPLLAAVVRDGTPIERVQSYVLDHLEESFTVASLAARAAMSPRNFARAFQREAGMTPMEFVLDARVEAARGALESGDQPLKTIAYRCGFGSARHMRNAFGERLGITPSQYRERFSVA